MPTTGQSAGKVLKRANPGTIQDKFLVGYQGWFTCANDGPPIGEGHHGWLHWLNQPLLPPANGRPNTDLWPDTSAYDATELYPVEGLAHRDGSPAKVFSSRDPRTVRRHFHWMAEHGVDGVFLQRFVGQVDPQEAGNRDARYGGTRRLRDEVGRRVREAAEAEGRVWAIMYDVSGVPAADVLRIITQDIAHLVHDERILESPAYLRERGRPVVAVWGFGLSDSPVPPQTARAVFAALRAAAGDVYIFAGVPSHWRTPGAGDSHADPAWPALWLGDEGAVDAISPWSVGRYSTGEEVERWAAERWAGDAELIAQLNEEIELSGGGGRKVDYVPVVLPGGSGFNLSEGKWGFNNIKRNGGKFLWAQIFHAKRLKGVRSMYGAMWDEYDEGTAFLPVVEKKRLLPESEKWPFLALDEDGYDIPSDWYMRIAGFAAEGLRSERRIHDSFPSKELQDYWSTRPRYEDAAAASSSASAGSAGASGSGSASAGGAKAETDAEREAKAQFDAWSEEQRRKETEGEDAPPPAYSLEDEGPGVEAEPAVAPAPVQQQHVPVQHQQNVAPQPQSPHVQQQPFAQQQQQFSPPHANYAAHPVADAAVGALAGDFARQRIGAELPQLPARRESGQGAGRVGGGGAALPEARPPVHPTLQAGRPGSQDSITSAGGSGGVPAQRPPLHPALQSGRSGSGSFGGRVGSPEGQRYGTPYQQQQGYQQAQHTGGSAGSAGSYPAQGGYQQQQNTGASGSYPGQGAYQQPQHTGGSASSSSYPAQGYQQQQHTGSSASSSYPAAQQQQPGPYPPQGAYQQQQHTGGSSSSYQHPQNTGGSTSSAYPAQAGPHQQYAPPSEPPRQQQQHTGGSGSYPPQGGYQQQQHTGGSSSSYQHPQHTGGSAPSAYPAQAGPHQQYAPPSEPPQQQHTGGSGSYPPQGGYQQQQHTGGSSSSYQHPQHTGGSASSAHPGQAPPPGRPASAYPGQTARPNPSYPPQAGTAGAGLGRTSASLSARLPSAMYSPQARPASAAPGPGAGYTPPPQASGSGYPQQHASLAPGPHARPECARPTTPGAGYAPPHQHAPPPQQHAPHAPYASQLPAPKPSPTPNNASYPGAAYQHGAPPSVSLPSPDIPGPAFPGGGAPYQQSPPAGYSPQSYPGSQGFPAPQPGGSPYPSTGPGPSFPQENGYFYQQPPQPQFPNASGYSPPQPDVYNPNYAPPQQPQGQGWAPSMPHRPGSIPQPQAGYGQPSPQPGYGQQPQQYGQQPGSYGYSFPTAQPASGPLGFATTSVDKIVGRRTRQQLEGTVETIAQSSNKLLSKFGL